MFVDSKKHFITLGNIGARFLYESRQTLPRIKMECLRRTLKSSGPSSCHPPRSESAGVRAGEVMEMLQVIRNCPRNNRFINFGQRSSRFPSFDFFIGSTQSLCTWSLVIPSLKIRRQNTNSRPGSVQSSPHTSECFVLDSTVPAFPTRHRPREVAVSQIRLSVVLASTCGNHWPRILSRGQESVSRAGAKFLTQIEPRRGPAGNFVEFNLVSVQTSP